MPNKTESTYLDRCMKENILEEVRVDTSYWIWKLDVEID